MQHFHRPEQARPLDADASSREMPRQQAGEKVVVISDQEGGRDGRDAFTTTCQAKAVCGGRGKTDGGADRFTHHQLRLGTPRSDPGATTDQLD